MAPALTSQVAAWLEGLVADSLEKQEAKLASIETIVADSLVSPESPLKLLTEQSAAISSSESRKQLAPIGRTAASKPSVHEAETALSDRMNVLAAETRAEPPPAIEPVPRSIDATPSPVGSASAVIPALRPEARPNRTPWLVAALFALVIPIVWLVARSDRQAPAPAATSTPPAAATSATIASASTATAPSATETASASASTTSEAFASASAAPTQPNRLPPPIRPAKTAKAPCAPFTIDPKTGRKTYNADCIP